MLYWIKSKLHNFKVRLEFEWWLIKNGCKYERKNKND